MDAMKKAQEFTSVAKDLQEQLKNTEIETTVRDGQVTVITNAQSVPIKVEVSAELVAKGAEEVSAAVTEGVKAAHQKSSEYMREKMGNLTKGMCFSIHSGQHCLYIIDVQWEHELTSNLFVFMLLCFNFLLVPLSAMY